MAIRINNRRLVIAYNPHSSRAAVVQTMVFDRLDAAGYQYDRLEVLQASLENNVARLVPQIQPHDLILSAAGDGSAHAVAHAVLAATQPGVELGFLAFGNFNDIPRSFNTRRSLRDPVAFLARAHAETLYPLSIGVNGVHVRHALLYATFGWTAQAAQRFDDPVLRRQLQTGKVGTVRNLWRLGLYYLSSRRHSYIPAFTQTGQPHRHVTDLLCVNGQVVAGLFRTGKKYYQTPQFLYKRLNVAWLIINLPFLLLGLIGRMPGRATVAEKMIFPVPAIVPAQCDGEVVELQHVSRLEITKSAAPLHILTTK